MNAAKLSAKPSILIVEDSSACAALFNAALSEDCHVDCAETFETAAEKLEHCGYDLILLDLGLPNSAGFETFVKAFRLCRDAAIVVITADDSLKDKCLEAGADSYLIKGAGSNQVEELRAACFSALANRNRKLARFASGFDDLMLGGA